MTEAYEIVEHSYDVVIVGAGGAGMRAALGMDQHGRNACVGEPFEHGARGRRARVRQQCELLECRCTDRRMETAGVRTSTGSGGCPS